MTAHRQRPEAILAHLTWATEPPTDAEVRTDFVRLAMSRFAWTRGYSRLASLFYSAPIDVLKGLFLALQGSPVGDNEDTCPVIYAKALKNVSPAWQDSEFVRLASVAGDVLDWDMAGEWDAYVRTAWLVLCDEVEFESERLAEDAEDRAACYEDFVKRMRYRIGYSRDEARVIALADQRRWRD